jgi:hypothetical protein
VEALEVVNPSISVREVTTMDEIAGWRREEEEATK